MTTRPATRRHGWMKSTCCLASLTLLGLLPLVGACPDDPTKPKDEVHVSVVAILAGYSAVLVFTENEFFRDVVWLHLHSYLSEDGEKEQAPSPA